MILLYIICKDIVAYFAPDCKKEPRPGRVFCRSAVLSLLFVSEALVVVRERALDDLHMSLPQCAFAHFGAGVKASVIFVRKRRENEKPDDNEAIFMAAPQLIGYDATGRKTESQLDDIVMKYEEFRKDAMPFFA